MDIQDYKGKSPILTDFYEKYLHFNYKQFICDNKLNFKTEEECIDYILKNEKEINLVEEVLLQKPRVMHYLNIFIGLHLSKKYYELHNFNKYNFKNFTHLNKKNLKNYDDNISYLVIDVFNINKDINDKYKDKIILYVEKDISDKNLSLIEKYNIENFIVKNASVKENLLSVIKDYKVIAEDKDFDKCFYEIYNYKKKYEVITEESNVYQIQFKDLCDVDIEISVKSFSNNFRLIINGAHYIDNINPNILNKIHIHLRNINKIEIKCLSQISFISFKYRKENEKIEQLYLSENLYKYKEDNRIHKCHKLKDYNNIYEPAFFYGFARKEDVETIKNHKGKKYVLFSGGDIDVMFHINKNSGNTKNRMKYLKDLHKLDEIYYIPRSEFMIHDMRLLNYKYKYYPFYADAYSKYQVKPKGNKIYFYTYPDYQKHRYGHLIVEEIKKRKPEYEFLQLTHPKAYDTHREYCNSNNIGTCKDNEELLQKYQECFIALRIATHDGIANTVLELGSLGIKTIYNDTQCPCALTYNSIDDIIDHIENEKKTIGTIDHKLIERVKNFITPDKEIYYTGFYE